MSIYGIGARYENDDVSDEFINNQVACIGWGINDAPSLFSILRTFKIGDIIYIKSSPIGQGLRVKAVGIIQNNQIMDIPDLGTSVQVRWIWRGHENLGNIDDRYNVRNNTLYEEFNPDVQQRILELLFSRIIAV